MGLAVVLAGCTGAEEPPDDGRSGEVTLTVSSGATGALVRNFNPYSATTQVAGQGPIYEPLMFFNLGRAEDVTPLLATGYTWSGDGRTLRFALREGVKWSDGKPFTARDVAFTFNLLKRHRELNVNGVAYDTITADDDRHVTITFTRPSFTDLWYVAGQSWILPEHVWSAVRDPGSFTDPRPVGTGPFMLRSFSTQNFSVVRNPGYWQPGKPQIAGLRFISLDGNEAGLAALRSGKVDWQSVFIPGLEEVWGSKAPTNDWINTPLFQTELTANLERFPSSDRAVRRALYYGVDRMRLNTAAFDNQATETTCALTLQPRDASWTDQTLPDLQPVHDPARAERILTAGGWVKGPDGIAVKRGKRLSMTLKVVTGWTDYLAAARLMVEQYRGIGIELRLQEVSFADFRTDRNTGDFDLVMDSVYGGPNPYYLYQSFLNSENTAPVGKVANPNHARYRNREVDRALATVAGTQDALTQKLAYSTIQRNICRDMPYVPLVQNSMLTEFRTDRVTGFPTKDDLYAIPALFLRPDLGVIAANLKVK